MVSFDQRPRHRSGVLRSAGLKSCCAFERPEFRNSGWCARCTLHVPLMGCLQKWCICAHWSVAGTPAQRQSMKTLAVAAWGQQTFSESFSCSVADLCLPCLFFRFCFSVPHHRLLTNNSRNSDARPCVACHSVASVLLNPTPMIFSLFSAAIPKMGSVFGPKKWVTQSESP